VLTDRTRVRAVGTEFDVYRKSNGTVVTVVQGRVAVLPELASIEPHATGTSAAPLNPATPLDAPLKPKLDTVFIMVRKDLVLSRRP
jgi:ferric-dicitrate binding protein FerR (iron transport regulator)